MTVLENTATSTIVNLFNSNQREYFKAKAVFDFLLKPYGKLFEDIYSVEEQKGDNGSIPDFTIILNDEEELRYEVKTSDAILTKQELKKDSRDFFLIPYCYKESENIPLSKNHILIWEDLFDSLDEQNIIIDGLDKVRESIGYSKINLTTRIWEIIARLQKDIPIDLDKVEINWNRKEDPLWIPLLNVDNSNGLYLSNNILCYWDEKNKKEIKLKHKSNEGISLLHLKRKDPRIIAKEIQIQLLKQNVCSKVETQSQVYKELKSKIVNKYKNKIKDSDLDEGCLDFILFKRPEKSDIVYYPYFGGSPDREFMEIGYGFIESQNYFPEHLKNHLQDCIEQIKTNHKVVVKPYSPRNKKSLKWICKKVFIETSEYSIDIVNTIYHFIDLLLDI